MAENSLNQVVLEALSRANANVTATPNIQSIIQDLLPPSGENFSSALTDASRQIDALRSANQALADVVQKNTQAVIQNSSTQSSGGNAAGAIGNVASTVFKSGLGLLPLITSLTRLFGSGTSDSPAPLVRSVAPAPLRLDLGYSGQTIAPVAYGQTGLPRLGQDNGAAPNTAPVAGPQISIQVNALDSRSFMDHSHEIAQAVREAMLNMHSLNDVVSEL